MNAIAFALMQNEPKDQNDLLGVTHGFLLLPFEFVNAIAFTKAPFANALLSLEF
ncbi:hypothetical protein DFQ09_103335 [Winogradskyella pacifica]|uniref:Uncharacterized protein n=1 Tax=Winogradskyella pacifica TaxID=664642 RepID=A0A3D9N0C3_9FLAO|nr:hypothetical protein [Winogradskyella pacifica]REE25027.1 hypothetical protein DFQ09_103335 [Winogradskyella pacifica]